MKKTTKTTIELYQDDIERLLSDIYGNPEGFKSYLTKTLEGARVIVVEWPTRPEDLEQGERV